MTEYKFPYTAEEICRRLDIENNILSKEEVPYTEIYAYDLQDLKNKETILSAPVFNFESYVYSGSDSEGDFKQLQFVYKITAAIKRGATSAIEYILDTPAFLIVENETDRYPHSYWTNLDQFFDCGIEIDGEIISFNEFVKDIVDGETIFKAYIDIGSRGSSTNWSQVAAKLSCTITIYVRGLEYATEVYEELSTVFEEYQTKFYMFFKNDPVEIIEAQYRG